VCQNNALTCNKAPGVYLAEHNSPLYDTVRVQVLSRLSSWSHLWELCLIGNFPRRIPAR